MSFFPQSLQQGGQTALLDPSRLLITFTSARDNNGELRRIASREAIESALASVRLGFEDDPWTPAGSSDAPRLNHTERMLWVRSLQGPVSDNAVMAIRDALKPHAEWVGPCYRAGTADGSAERVGIIPDVVLLRFSTWLEQDKDGQTEVLRALASLKFREDRERSQRLRPWRYFVLDQAMNTTVFDHLPRLRQRFANALADLQLECVPYLSPLHIEPDDEHFAAQWSLRIIDAPRAWDTQRDGGDVILGVIDSGCDLTHPDLQFAGPGLNTADPERDGSPIRNASGSLNPHGTYSAGVAGAITNNRLGVAGIASCRIVPVAVERYSHVDCAIALRYAVEQGARVVNMSFNTPEFGFATSPFADALSEASAADVVLCASAGNGDVRGILMPARHPLVMACGVSDDADERWSVAWHDGSRRGSHYGDDVYIGEPVGVSVVAPGWKRADPHGVPTTDIQGLEGFPSLPSPAGDYYVLPGYVASSAAAAHVSGVAVLLRAAFPEWTASDVRQVIERTADRVGSMPYASVDGYPHGPRNEQMGYGRLNAWRALGLADVFIRDWPGDTGTEPSTPPAGRFWTTSDIVIRPSDDGVFAPDVPELSSVLTPGQTNVAYVRVVNTGPRVARDVRVSLRATVPAVEFTYPDDWHAEEPTHVRPEDLRAAFETVDVGGSVLAAFVFTEADVARMVSWVLAGQHPCLLAEVSAVSDHAFEASRTRGTDLVVRLNNLAQRNLRLDLEMRAGRAEEFVFMAGSDTDMADFTTLVVDAGALGAAGRVMLCVSEPTAPSPAGAAPRGQAGCGGTLRLLEPTRVEADWCGCRAEISVAKGTVIELGTPALTMEVKEGATLDARCARLRAARAVVAVRKRPGQRFALRLRCEPEAEDIGRRHVIHVARVDSTGRTVGGVTFVLGRDD